MRIVNPSQRFSIRRLACRAVLAISPLAGIACGELELNEATAAIRRAPVSPALGERALEHATRIVGFGERYPGSPGWRQQLDYIQAQLRAFELEPTTDRWTDPTFEIDLVNVSATLPGSSVDRLLLGCHHDTKHTHGHAEAEQNFEFVGANDGASGVGLVLALAEHWARAKAQGAELPTIEFVFFDGEEARCFDWDEDQALFGSKRFVARYRERRAETKSRIRAMILLDMVGARELSIDDDTHSDRALHKIFAAAARATGHERHFFKQSMAISDDHVPFLNAGIPAIDLIDFIDNPQWHTPDDTLEHLSADSMQKVAEVVLAAWPAVVRRYLPAPRKDR